MPTALITGANQGIGFEFVRQYAADGWQVIATCRRPDAAADLRALADTAPHVRIAALDVTDAATVARLAADLHGQPLDLLVNNAGMIGPHPVIEHIGLQHFGSIDYELWQDVIATNTFGPVRVTEALMDSLQAAAHPKVVTISSTVGSITERDTPAMAYGTSKAAVNKAMRILSAQLRDAGISVALLCPGRVKTRMDFGEYDDDVATSVAGMRILIEDLTPENSGFFKRYNGETIAW